MSRRGETTAAYKDACHNISLEDEASNSTKHKFDERFKHSFQKGSVRKQEETDLVDAAGEVNNDLAGAVVVDDLELSDVTVLHHDGKESDDDLKKQMQKPVFQII